MKPTIVSACGEAGIPIVRSMVAVELGKAGYADTIIEHRRLWDEPHPDSRRNRSDDRHSKPLREFRRQRHRPLSPHRKIRSEACLCDPRHGARGHCRRADRARVDLLWPRMRGLINFKSALSASASTDRRRARPSTGRIGPPRPMPPIRGAALVGEMVKRGFTGTFCLPAEYSDPAGRSAAHGRRCLALPARLTSRTSGGSCRRAGRRLAGEKRNDHRPQGAHLPHRRRRHGQQRALPLLGLVRGRRDCRRHRDATRSSRRDLRQARRPG